VTRDHACNYAIARCGVVAGPLQEARAMMKRLVVLLALGACGKKSARIGIAECDAYQEKMAACAQKIGGSVGQQLDKTSTMMADAWRAETSNKELPAVCASAITDMQKQLPQCAW
jgi:hypothetical protein